jgi:hypothetical protein
MPRSYTEYKSALSVKVASGRWLDSPSPVRAHALTLSLAVVLLSPRAKKNPAEAGGLYRYRLEARHGRFVERDYIT